MARVLFFGRLRDVAGASERIESGALSVSTLMALLHAHNPDLGNALEAKGVRIAINQKLIALGEDPMLKDTDEVAFMPPFSGG